MVGYYVTIDFFKCAVDLFGVLFVLADTEESASNAPLTLDLRDSKFL
jgi:hypothetical protein